MPNQSYPASTIPTGSRPSAQTKPVTPQDKNLSDRHKQEALDYNEEHAREHLEVAEGIRSTMGESRTAKYPTYGFYGPESECVTVPDEQGVGSNVTLGFRDQTGEYLRSNNDHILGEPSFEQSDAEIDSRFGSTGYPMV